MFVVMHGRALSSRRGDTRPLLLVRMGWHCRETHLLLLKGEWLVFYRKINVFAQACALGMGTVPVQVAWRPHHVSILSCSLQGEMLQPQEPFRSTFAHLWSCTQPLDLVGLSLSVASLLKQLFCVCPRRRKSLFLLVSLSSGTSTRDNPGATS